jgi:alpha-acetolactate decarboxylase
VSKSYSLEINSLSLIFAIASMLYASRLSDKYGRKPILLLVTATLAILSYPLYEMMLSDIFLHALLGQGAFGVLLGAFMGIVGVVMVEEFKKSVRVSAVSIAFNLSFAIFGGTAPMVATWLIHTSHDNLSLAWYLSFSAVVSFLAALTLKKPSQKQPEKNLHVKPNMLYQIGTINSLLSGVYEGDLSFKELSHYGNFGLGTFDRVNGEMIAFDGEFYRIDAMGNAHKVNINMKTPFSIVTHFKNYENYEISTCENIFDMQEQISMHFESQNIIYAICIEGEFLELDLRSEHPQPQGHKPLSQTMSEVQETLTLKDTCGIMVGFWFAEHLKTINMPGFHFHFIDEKKERGGHVFDVKVKNATLKIVPIFDFGMHLIHTPLFEGMNIEIDKKDVDKVEVKNDI